jgi:hypothetical protein
MNRWIGPLAASAVALGLLAEPASAGSALTPAAQATTRPAERAVSVIPVPTAVASGVALLALVALRRFHRELNSD